MKIAELEVGKAFQGTLVLAEATLRKTNTRPPKDFLQATFTDGVEQITGMRWNWNVSQPAPDANFIYDLSGNVGEYQGKKQLTIDSIRLADNQDMSDFQATYCDCPEYLFDRAITAITHIDNEGLRSLVNWCYVEYARQIKEASSANSIHHAGSGGNIAHTMEVYEAATRIAEMFSDRVSVDLVAAGALLHDIGKISTYMITGPVIEYTEAGHLFDHILLGIEILMEANVATQFRYNAEFELLKHIIASHHGKQEYGSPVTPKFMEAYIVSIADGISATMDTLWTVNTKAEKDGKPMTDRIWTQGNVPHILQSKVKGILSQRYYET